MKRLNDQTHISQQWGGSLPPLPHLSPWSGLKTSIIENIQALDNFFLSLPEDMCIDFRKRTGERERERKREREENINVSEKHLLVDSCTGD